MALNGTADAAAETRSPTHNVIFSEDYYQRLIHEYGYDKFALERFSFPLAGMTADELNMRWLCHHRAADFVAAPAGSRIITTGFGMSGVPHMGTVAQILGISRLQGGGERCQIVLGDLDAHNGKGRPLSQARELADRYATFCRRLGFDDSAGVLRSQFHNAECLRNLYLLGFFAADADFERAEEDNHGYYASLGVVDDRMTFRRKVSLALMAADFVTLGQRFDAVLVMLGVDEHKYVRFSDEIARRLDDHTILRGTFTLAAIYSRLTAGFGGHPKMSKSIPGSSINVESTSDQVVARVMGDRATTPERSPTYQLICQTFLRPYDECRALADACATDSAEWARAKAELADYLISVIELW